MVPDPLLSDSECEQGLVGLDGRLYQIRVGSPGTSRAISLHRANPSQLGRVVKVGMTPGNWGRRETTPAECPHVLVSLLLTLNTPW